MAVIVEDSLANRAHGGRRCRRRELYRPTVLETAIRVSGQVDPSKQLREQPVTLVPGNQDPWHQEQISWQKYWDPKLLKQGSTFWLGYQGQLKVAGLISETGLLMTWDKDWLEGIRKLLELKSAGPGSICHNEFSGEM
ncbi:hypothetical protein EG329_013438 [Mollisiaceae sp. DMI_Dod_QoI]|nr:hypothetical protein EG329_013438 [Helotiales sp. DMI_Dod_QoI]